MSIFRRRALNYQDVWGTGGDWKEVRLTSAEAALGVSAVLAAVVLEAHGHVFSLIPVRAAVLAAALRDRALLGELPPIVSVRAEQNGVRKRPWPGASCGGCLNEGTRGPMGRKSGHGVVFMTHHRRQPGRSRTHERRRTALTRAGLAFRPRKPNTSLSGLRRDTLLSLLSFA